AREREKRARATARARGIDRFVFIAHSSSSGARSAATRALPQVVVVRFDDGALAPFALVGVLAAGGGVVLVAAVEELELAEAGLAVDRVDVIVAVAAVVAPGGAAGAGLGVLDL